MKFIFHLTLIGGLTLSLTPSVSGFISYRHHFGIRFNSLIHKVHEPNWTISYRYATECKAADRQDKILEEAITTALQAWLQPLRELQTARPIVNDFRYKKNADLASSNMRITFYCTHGKSQAWVHTLSPPDITMRRGVVVNDELRHALAHEIGHAFGLADTYVGRVENVGKLVVNKPSTTTGGLNDTVGTQPVSVMSHSVSFPRGNREGYLREDDKRGIVWLYKAFHEGLQIDDCFFPEYVYEEEPAGCRPKHPLIFQIKYGRPGVAFRPLNEDPEIDINAQDADGFTALHYVVMYEEEEVVQRLLAHQDIKPELRNKQGRRALDIAREAKLTRMVELLEAVTPQQIVADLNGDGTVNILDLVVVATNFGKTGKNIADVDGNGVVDIRDLVKVASVLQ